MATATIPTAAVIARKAATKAVIEATEVEEEEEAVATVTKAATAVRKVEGTAARRKADMGRNAVTAEEEEEDTIARR